jgi:SAM-dependent methyltransferase
MSISVSNRWKLPNEPFKGAEGPDWYTLSERVVEIPWALSLVDKSQRVLDVGYAYSEERYIKPLCDMGVEELYGSDWAEPKQHVKDAMNGKMKTIKHDLRDRYPDEFQGFFDLILCVSTIEHVGQDNSHWYFKDDKYGLDGNADVAAIINMRDALKVGGLLAITVPYGEFMQIDCFKQYDKATFDNLVDKSGMEVVARDYFVNNKDGWYNSTEEGVKDKRYAAYGIMGSTGLLCIILRRV